MCPTVSLKDTFKVSLARNFNQVFWLCQCNTIEVWYDTLKLHWFCESVVNHVNDGIGCDEVVGQNYEVVYLTHEKDLFSWDDTSIQTRSMLCRFQAYLLDDLLNMLRPETWSFGVTLHVAENQDNEVFWNGFTFEMMFPLVSKLCV